MFIYWFMKLNRGDLCKVIAANNEKYNGEIVTFKEVEYHFQLPSYVFENSSSEKVVISNENGFQVLPYRNSLLYLIDLALQVRDEEWCRELVYKLTYESQPC